jgi:hypothetical protein
MEKENLIIPKFILGEKVFAIDGNEGHIKIWNATIESITIEKSGILYWLLDEEGLEWEDCVKEENISKDYKILFDKLAKLWGLC